MAASLLNLLAVAALLWASLIAQAAEKPLCTEPIEFKSDGNLDVDFRSGKTVMHDVSISQCDVSIKADRAEATPLDFKDSRWVFSGDVRITAEQRGIMRSDRAEVEFLNNRIARATIKGKPARFEQTQADTRQMARGRADEIVYDVGAGTVRFANDAWLTYGGKEMTALTFIYNIRLRTVKGQQVRGTIIPNTAQKP